MARSERSRPARKGKPPTPTTHTPSKPRANLTPPAKLLALLGEAIRIVSKPLRGRARGDALALLREARKIAQSL